ncbi:MAG: galactosylceramidase [Ktedonobacteraceae bacterium]|nr:galactosylceramidase [Ktedonobacteraceae bacterium]
MSKDMDRRKFLGVASGTTLAAFTLGEGIAHAAPAVSTAIAINGASGGRTFDGVGGLSGGGGTSRLLFDYPATQQAQILDYLFKPNYAASLQILKVEIGSDSNSTNGAEASHMRSRTDQNYTRGYEWWLMEQAHARNPNIKFYGLQWGAPGWFTGGFWSDDNITYIMNWIGHAKSDHGLTIDYIGGWNESGYNKAWYEKLKAAIKSHGFSTKVVASDEAGWNVVTDMTSDATFNSSIDIVGSHYPVTDARIPPAAALNLGKPLWASESGSQGYDKGAKALAHNLNRNYVAGKMTADINWSLIAAWYPTLPFAGDGLMLAEEPWSGYYYVAKSIWAMAHTAQFTQPGWKYLDSGCGYLGGNSVNGSYVTLKSTNGKDYSMIIETMSVSAAQTASFTVSGGLSTGIVHVWASNFSSTSGSAYFVHQQDITPSGGKFSLTLQPGYLYSLTTTTGQGKGTVTSPASSGLALPYRENFDGYATGKLARYYSDLAGAFETAAAGGGRSGNSLRQVITTAPIAWHSGSPTPPITVVGDPNWTNYTVSVDVLLEKAGYVELIGNLTSQVRLGGAAVGYHLRITNTGAWTLFKEANNNNTIVDTKMASGTATFSLNTWHTLALTMARGNVQAFINGTRVANINDSTYTKGQFAFLVSKWVNAQFDNVSVVSA